MSIAKFLIFLGLVLSLFFTSCLQSEETTEVFRYTNTISLADSTARQADSAVVYIQVTGQQEQREVFKSPLDATLKVTFDAEDGAEISITYRIYEGDSIIFQDEAAITSGSNTSRLSLANQITFSQQVVTSSNAPSSTADPVSSARSSSSVPISVSVSASSSSKLISSSLASSSATQSSSVAPISSSAKFDPTGVTYNGRLKVSGAKIVNQHDSVFQIRGVSIGWINKTDTAWWTQTVFHELKTVWNVNTIHLVFYDNESETIAKQYERYKGKLQQTMQLAIDEELYVIVGFARANNTAPSLSTPAFFASLATDFGATDHLIYEMDDGTSESDWTKVKTYDEGVIGAIRQRDPDNLIIATTPKWSTDLNGITLSPLTDANVGYKMGFDTRSNGGQYTGFKNKVQTAVDSNLAVVNTYFGANGYTCNEAYSSTNVTNWLNDMDSLGVGVIAVKIGYGDLCAMLSSSASPTGNWDNADFTDWGLLIRDWSQGVAQK